MMIIRTAVGDPIKVPNGPMKVTVTSPRKVFFCRIYSIKTPNTMKNNSLS